MSALKLSVLDLVPVRTDQATADALAATLALARTADELGYHRYWLAEHHNMPAVAATNPPVLVGLVASATSRMRVGSGGVMLPNHAPLVVAEQFALLEAAYPGRIDLGIGRAPGTDPVTSFALRHGAGGVTDEAVSRFPEYVDNVLAMMEPSGVGLSVAGRTHALKATPVARTVPTIWLLGSSDYSARLAAEKGMPYVFAHHFSGSGTAEALELYRSTFRPVARELAEPRHLPHGERRGRRVRRGGRAARAAQPPDDGRAAHRRPARTPAPGRGGREGRGARRAPPADRRDALPLGHRRPRLRPRPARALAATYGVDEVMVHPVAAAHVGTDPTLSPAREETLRTLGSTQGTGPGNLGFQAAPH